VKILLNGTAGDTATCSDLSGGLPVFKVES